MTLKVIGAGFGRTGTESMKTALEMLGFGPCHHMVEVLPSEEQVAFWKQAIHEATPDWKFAYRDYQSAVDWPTAYYWRQLSEYYPQAKILLTVRDPEAWFNSFSKTILPMVQHSEDKESMATTLIRAGVFKGNLEDPEHMIAIYKEHIETVQATIPPERLLTYTTGSGWAPLCEFLGVPVPEEDYPSMNQQQGFKEKIETLKEQNPLTP
jgi:Sulfotransferase domain